jgi:hypothetical protein
MKFFVDTADIKEIKDLMATGMVDGVTTNPTLAAKSGKKFVELIAEICAVGKAGTFTYTGGTLTVSSLGGEPIIPGIQYTIGARQTNGTSRQFVPSDSATVPAGYPTTLSTNFTVSMGPVIPTRTITVQLRKSGTPVTGARVDVQGGPSPGYYLTATSNGSGDAVIRVPQGSGYTVTAWNAAGTGTGQALNVDASSNVTVTVNVP